MKDFKSIKNWLYKSTCLIMIFFFGLIFIQTTQNLSHMDFIAPLLTGIRKPLFILCGTLLLTFLVSYLSNRLNRCVAKTQNYILVTFLIIGLFLQLTLILNLQPCLQYDSLKPVDTAISMLKGTPLAATEYYNYFSIYPHNVPLTLYIMCIFKIAGFLGIAETNYIILLQILNCLLIDLAIVQMFCLIRKTYGNSQSLTFGLLCVFNPLIYYYPIFFYTQTLSIPLFVFLIILFFKILDSDTLKKRIIFSVFYGIVLFFGWKIRFFTLITLIANAMFLFFRKKETSLNRKVILSTFMGILLSFFLCFGINELLMEKYTIHTEESQAFPIHHWIMMGLHGDGTFYYADEDFTSAFPGKDSRIEQNTRVIKERLNNLGPKGLLKLWGRKINITWSDGYDDYSSNLILVDHYGRLNDYLTGYRSEFLVAYLHIYNCMLWMLLTICAIKITKKKSADFIYTLSITILGGIIFHLFWEAGEPYSMPFILLIIGGASSGMESIVSITQKGQHRKIIYGILLSSFTIFIICSSVIIFSFTSKNLFVKEIAAIQNLVGGDYLHLRAGDTITQTVLVSRDFNTITLRYKYYQNSTGDVQLRFRVYDQNGNCLTEQTMPTQNAVTLIDFSFPTISPEGKEEYLLELSAISLPENSSLGITGYNTGNWDTYKNGTLYQNGIEILNGDIYFELSNQTMQTLF